MRTGPAATSSGLLAAMTMAALLAACGGRPEVQRFEGFAQGTMYHVAYVAPAGHDTAGLQRAVEAELQLIDRLYSNYRDDSVVERFNAERSTGPVEVGPELVALVEKARSVHQASRGCFEPTVGPLTALWRRVAEDQRLPDPRVVERIRERIGLDRLETADATRLRKTRPDMEIDLSGIAQGESLARLADVVEAAGIDAYSIEIGGELVVRGGKPGGEPWRIAVLDPARRDAAIPEVIEYAGDRRQTIATSGTYQREFEIDGQRYSHIIDPRTGRPVAHDTVSVTVAHPDPALADAWSTALLCLGVDDGIEVADEQRISAMFIAGNGARSVSAEWR
ncbi:MAG: FAD:protein FMN transferase [Wenzhouxiangellaceae bacterium]|nr:FAD:protein FMN transferase [Wenzhouxiangellaceae bacterium]